MMFDERTIARGLDDLAVKWNPKYEKFQAAPVPQKKRDWLDISTPAPVIAAQQTNALQTSKTASLGAIAIRAAVMKVCDVSESDFLSVQRSWHISRPRQLFFYLCRKHTSRSFPEIGRMAGDKSNATVIHGANNTKKFIAAGDAKTISQLNAIEAMLGVGQ